MWRLFTKSIGLALFVACLIAMYWAFIGLPVFMVAGHLSNTSGVEGVSRVMFIDPRLFLSVFITSLTVFIVIEVFRSSFKTTN